MEFYERLLKASPADSSMSFERATIRNMRKKAKHDNIYAQKLIEGVIVFYHARGNYGYTRDAGFHLIIPTSEQPIVVKVADVLLVRRLLDVAGPKARRVPPDQRDDYLFWSSQSIFYGCGYRRSATGARQKLREQLSKPDNLQLAKSIRNIKNHHNKALNFAEKRAKGASSTVISERHKDGVWLCPNSLAIAAEARAVEGDSTATSAGEEDEVDTSSESEPSNDDDEAPAWVQELRAKTGHPEEAVTPALVKEKLSRRARGRTGLKSEPNDKPAGHFAHMGNETKVVPLSKDTDNDKRQEFYKLITHFSELGIQFNFNVGLTKPVNGATSSHQSPKTRQKALKDSRNLHRLVHEPRVTPFSGTGPQDTRASTQLPTQPTETRDNNPESSKHDSNAPTHSKASCAKRTCGGQNPTAGNGSHPHFDIHGHLPRDSAYAPVSTRQNMPDYNTLRRRETDAARPSYQGGPLIQAPTAETARGPKRRRQGPPSPKGAKKKRRHDQK